MVVRHGTRLPSAKDILGMNSVLEDLKHEILLQNRIGKGPLNSEQLDDFEKWYNKLEIEKEKFLTYEGQNEMILLAERTLKRFPNAIKREYNNNTFEFRYTATQRAQQSARYFTVGLFDKKISQQVVFAPATKIDMVLRVLEYYIDLKHYWLDGYGFDLTYRQACILMKNLFERFRGDGANATFLFAHSGTLLKLLTHLELYKPERPLTGESMNKDRAWRASDIDCFASNLAFVLYNPLIKVTNSWQAVDKSYGVTKLAMLHGQSAIQGFNDILIMNLKLNNEVRGSISLLPAPPVSSIKEERRRTGRYIAILVGISLLILAIYHAWVRRIPVVASLVVPALIMFVYVAWVLYTASRDKHKFFQFQDPEAALTSGNEANDDGRVSQLSNNNLEELVISSKESSKVNSPRGSIRKEWSRTSSTHIKEERKSKPMEKSVNFIKPIILVNDKPPEDLDQKWSHIVQNLTNNDKLKGFSTRRRYKRKFCRRKRNAAFKRSYSIG
ncbi:Multiple inositol polyphosphate phosphatase 1 [Papilio machaon]|uniref:Multiple inositol polyphosphate phosphatase 1 n=2 Tax=Papilio machaon TaxID=76193 RepID=A0A194QRN0_PAPMA|nr:Multiple inositol polyphosphate phosphatase 1 [Papilio machaon]